MLAVLGEGQCEDDSLSAASSHAFSITATCSEMRKDRRLKHRRRSSRHS